MKKVLKSFLRNYLRTVAFLAVLIHKPKIIVIAGSTNKSFFKEEISRVLREKGLSVRSNIKSFNTDIGLPLAILSLPSGYGDYKAWLPLIISAPGKIFEKNFPKILVLELGVSDPGDMKFLLSMIKPEIAVITNITQRYIEGFSDMDELVGEYEYLSNSIDPSGLLIFNADNQRVREIAGKAKVKKISFGFTENSDWKIKSNQSRLEKQVMQIEHDGIRAEEIINRPGVHHLMARIAAKIIEIY